MTKHLHTIAVLGLTALLLAGCSNDLNADAYTFACDGDADCAPGFVCGAQGTCVDPSAVTDSGSDGAQDAEDADASTDTVDTSDTTDTTEDADAENPADTTDDTDDDSCTPMTWYADEDGDSYGDPDTTREACDRPAGTWVSNGDDCDDSDVRAFPGQTDFFESERKDGMGFDFDCDGNVVLEYEDVSTGCSAADGGGCGINVTKTKCNPTTDVVGWKNSQAECGQQKDWVTGCSDQCVSSCDQARVTTSRTQGCR